MKKVSPYPRCFCFSLRAYRAPNFIHQRRIVFAADGDASFGEKVFYISMSEIESVVEPNCVADDVRREPVAFICIHWPILAVTAS
jgi:hypothetical protein